MFDGRGQKKGNPKAAVFLTKPTKPAKLVFCQVGSPTGSPTGSRRLAGFPWLCLCFVSFDCFVTLFYHNFLRLHIVAIDEAQDINARRHSARRDAIGSAESSPERITRPIISMICNIPVPLTIMFPSSM